ncbi:MAG: hypothetical protein ACTSWN_07560, partial [Promethearchaeota archaeon]
DLTFYKGYFWLVYRQGTGHVSPHGKIVACRSKNGNEWEIVEIISRDGLDLRDPRIYVFNDELYILAFSLKYFDKKRNKFLPGDCYIYRLNDPNENTKPSFSLHATFENAKYKDTLWSLATSNNEYYATGYRWYPDGHYTARLWKASSLTGPWSQVVEFPGMILPPNKGFTEIDLVPLPEGKLAAFFRVDTDSFHRIWDDEELFEKAWEAYEKRMAQYPLKPSTHDNFICFGTANHPFSKWNIKTHELYLKGPRAIAHNESFLVVGRTESKVKGRRDVTLLYYDGGFHSLLTLATGNDGSYAGLIWNPDKADELLISFYSDHQRIGTTLEGKANDIWFAMVKISK